MKPGDLVIVDHGFGKSVFAYVALDRSIETAFKYETLGGGIDPDLDPYVHGRSIQRGTVLIVLQVHKHLTYSLSPSGVVQITTGTLKRLT